MNCKSPMFRRALAGIAVTLLVLGLLPQSYVL